MKKKYFIRFDSRILTLLTFMLLFSFLFGFGCSGKRDKKELKELKPPVAEKIKKELTIHGHTRIDNYYWLQERKNPKVMEYLKAENEYKDTVMKHTEGFQNAT